MTAADDDDRTGPAPAGPTVDDPDAVAVGLPGETPADVVAAARPSGVRRAARLLLGALALGLLVWYLVAQGDEVVDGLRRMSPGAVAGATVLLVAGLLANMLSWRAVLRGLGSPLPVVPAARVYLVAQIGKYLPGSVWPVLAQVELARDYSVPRRRSAAAAMVALLLGLAVGVAVAAVCLVAGDVGEARSYAWVLAVVPAVVALLHPAVLRRCLSLLGRLTRRPVDDVEVSGRDLLVAAAWSTAMWLLFGLHVWLLAGAGGDDSLRLLLVATGAYAAAWVAGFSVLFLPAGAGAREAALWVLLGTVLPHGDAVAVALVSRAVSVLGDGVTCGGAVLAERRRARTLAARH